MERTRSLIIVGFAILMAVSLVVFYAPGRNSPSSPSARAEVLATVGSDEITVGDILDQLGDSGESKLNRQIAGIVLQQLIPQHVILQEAKRLGLTASDEEVKDAIRQMKQFQNASGGFIGLEKYQAMIGDVAKFEKQVADDLARKKLIAFITASVTVSEQEIQSKFERQNTTFELVYVPIVADKLAEKINPMDQELRAFYDQNKESYRILEPQKKIRYLFINQDKVAEKIQIPDAKLREEYDKLSDENKQAGVEVQQILLKVARPDLDDQVREKAEKLVTQLRGTTGQVTKEAFANAAKGNSEDPATAKNGGLLLKPYKADPNKPDALYDRVANLQPGEITDAVKYNGNWYILRRGDVVTKTFEAAKPELLASARNTESYAIASAIAQRAAARLKETKDVQKTAQEFAKEANMTTDKMVQETPYIVPGDDVPNIGSSQQFEDGIKPLENPNDVGNVTPIPHGFAIPMLVDKKEPNRIPEFEEIKDKVLKAYRKDQAKAKLEETARNLANNTASAAGLKAAAEQLGLEAKTATKYSVGFPLGELDAGPAGEDVIFGLQEGAVSKTPIKMGDTWVVVGATKREPANLSDFAKQHDTLMQRELDERRSQVFQDYIVATQHRMENEGKIKIYEDQLAKLGGDEEQQQPPIMTSPPRPGPGRPIQIPAK